MCCINGISCIAEICTVCLFYSWVCYGCLLGWHHTALLCETDVGLCILYRWRTLTTWLCIEADLATQLILWNISQTHSSDSYEKPSRQFSSISCNNWKQISKRSKLNKKDRSTDSCNYLQLYVIKCSIKHSVPQYTKTLKQILMFLHIMYSILYTCRRNNRVCKWKPTGHVDFISDRMGLDITELLTHNIETHIEIDCKHECATRRDKCLHPTYYKAKHRQQHWTIHNN